MRTQKSFINLIVGWFGQISTVLLQFVLRTIFIRALSEDYLGMNGLFSNILNFLSFAELGFGAAITFSLYEPIAHENLEKISGIMNYFKKVYYLVGSFILAAGLAITPFVTFFVAEVPDIPHFYLIYMLFVVNSGISYFAAYKSTLIIACQKKYIVELNTLVFKFFTMLFQIFALVVLRSYILYLIMQILGTAATNISVSIRADKMFPYLRTNRTAKISEASILEIKRNVGATIMHKVGAVVIFGTDNILLSKFFGLAVAGLYSNYYMVINTMTTIVGQIQASIFASVGNLGAEGDNEKKQQVFEKYFFMNFWVFCFTSACMLSLLRHFVSVWVGEKYTLPSLVVCVVVFNYYLTGIRSAAATFDNAFGLFWNTRKLPVIESILNLVLSIWLAQYIGYVGIFVGTTISSLVSGAWYEPYVLYKYGFHAGVKGYYLRLIEALLVMALNCAIVSFVVSLIPVPGWIGFFVKGVAAALMSNGLLLLLYFRSERIRGIYDLIGKLWTMILQKLEKK